MSTIPTYDPMTSDARSSWLAGLTEACNKISGTLNMKTSTFEDLTLPELYISEDDRFRIYQAPLGNKLWLANPAPVIKKNGVVITPTNDHFSIDYLGGSIAFEDEYVLTASDVVTASATYIVDGSGQIDTLIEQIEAISTEAGRNKGAYDSLTSLQAAYPTATAGDFAIVTDEDTIYIWDVETTSWVNIHKDVDLSAYYTSAQTDNLLNSKEDSISAHGTTATSDNYYYGGRKTWIDLFSKIRSFALTGLVTDDNSVVTAADTLLVALGKLQAQISGFEPYIKGTSAPTTSTVGKIGQDYINTSNGDKYHLVSIEDGVYTWEKYGNVSSKNAVTVDGGGILEIPNSFGSAPYTIQFTEEDEEPIEARDISYSNAQSGATSDNVQSAIDAIYVEKQRKLTGHKTQIVGFDSNGDASAIQMWSNPNLLDNWYFADPVNQRGLTHYVGEGHIYGMYSIDQFQIYNGVSCDLVSGGLEFTFPGYSDAGNYIFGQPLENVSGLRGKTVTLSVLVTGYTGGEQGVQFFAKFYNDYHNSFGSSTLQGTGLYSATFLVPDDAEMILVGISSPLIPVTITVMAVKLELGSQQTLAHQNVDGSWVLNDPMPNKSLELLKCQRYFQVFSSESLRHEKAIDCRPTMRVNPTFGTIEVDNKIYYTMNADL